MCPSSPFYPVFLFRLYRDSGYQDYFGYIYAFLGTVEIHSAVMLLFQRYQKNFTLAMHENIITCLVSGVPVVLITGLFNLHQNLLAC